VAEGTDRVDGEAGLKGVEPNRSSLNGSACCGTVPLCVCERLDESLGTFGGGATMTDCFHRINVKTHTHTWQLIQKLCINTNLHFATASGLKNKSIMQSSRMCCHAYPRR
jgi:hypothetical protein